MNIHPSFKTPKILDFISDLIAEYNYDSYSDLSEDDRACLTSLLIEVAGRSDEFCCITESTHADQTINLFRKALTGNLQDDANFLEIIKENAIEYYDRTMESLFDYVLDDHLRERNTWLDKIARLSDPDDMYEQYKDNVA